MKKVVNVSLGGRNFILNEDAYTRLQDYLSRFKNRLTVPEYQKAEVMEEIEGRIAELFFQEVGEGSRVVTLEMAQQVASVLGMPDGSAEGGFAGTGTSAGATASRRLYRDVDNKSLAGVCSGLAHHFDVDVTLIRIIMLLALIFGSAGFWIYVILWIAVPKADTPAKKCEMHGLPPTAENLSAFARETYKK